MRRRHLSEQGKKKRKNERKKKETYLPPVYPQKPLQLLRDHPFRIGHDRRRKSRLLREALERLPAVRDPELDPSDQDRLHRAAQELERGLDGGLEGVRVGVSVREHEGDGIALEGRVGEPRDVAGDVDVD